ncbi:hypothetical protein R6Z07M_016992 [Ovis aries]
MKVKSESEVAQSYPTLSDLIDCSLPGSFIHGIFQARVLEWVAIAFSMTNLDSILKSREITWLTKVRLVKAMVFPVVMYGYESWTIKKAECRRIDASERWCWKGLLRVPWIARRSNKSILKEISPEYSLEGLMMKLKLQYFGHQVIVGQVICICNLEKHFLECLLLCPCSEDSNCMFQLSRGLSLLYKIPKAGQGGFPTVQTYSLH